MKSPLTALIMLFTILALAATLAACGGDTDLTPEPGEPERPSNTARADRPAGTPASRDDQPATTAEPTPTAATHTREATPRRERPTTTAAVTADETPTPTAAPDSRPEATAAPIPEDPTPRPQVANPSAETDRQALLALRAALNYPVFNDEWDPEEDPLTWHYIGDRYSDNGRVTSITLAAHQDHRPMPITREAIAHIGNLTELREIAIRDATLPDGIAPELGNLSNLEKLWISADVTGHIPAFLANMPSLHSLALSGSFTRHRIPHDLLANTAITNISLVGLQLEADINTVLTPEIMPPDRYITLQANQLTGQLSKEVDDLLIDRPRVQFSRNPLQGCVSSALKHHQSLDDLQVCPYGDSSDHQSMIALRDAITPPKERLIAQFQTYN